MKWKRLAENKLQKLSESFPAVVILGSRQVGKTTLARSAFPNANYQDIESPLIHLRFSEDPTYELNRFKDLTILDEAQAVPSLFPALRGVIDEKRTDRKCHFCILGSAQPSLLKAVSESLAGRVGLLELNPLTPAETGLPFHRHWLEGGFPEALLGDFRTWWDPYLNAILQRDLASYGLRPDAFFLRRLLTMIASQQGGLINSSALGNALGVSHNTVRHALDVLEGVFLIRRLPPYFQNIGKRIVKTPKIYIRDTGLLHHLLHISNLQELDSHLIHGMSWEGFVIEDLIRREQITRPQTQFYFWRTSAGEEADLVMDRGNEKIVIEVKANSGTNPHDARKLEKILDQIGATQGYIIGRETPSKDLTKRIQNISIDLDPQWLPD